MIDVQSIFKNTLIEAFSFKRYTIFNWCLIILFIILMLPIIIITVYLGILYAILIFIYKLLCIPSNYIKKTIEKINIQPVLLFIIYFVVYTVTFLFDLLDALILMVISVVHLFFVSFAYLMSLGGIKWQYFLIEADGRVQKPTPTYRMNMGAQFTFFGIIILLIGSVILSSSIIINVKEKNERIDYIAYYSADYLEKVNINTGFTVVGSYYLDSTSSLDQDFALIQIKVNDKDYFLHIQNDNSRYYMPSRISMDQYVKYQNPSNYEKYEVNIKDVQEKVEYYIKAVD